MYIINSHACINWLLRRGASTILGGYDTALKKHNASVKAAQKLKDQQGGDDDDSVVGDDVSASEDSDEDDDEVTAMVAELDADVTHGRFALSMAEIGFQDSAVLSFNQAAFAEVIIYLLGFWTSHASFWS